MATETLINVGLAKNRGSLGVRNYEDSGTVPYKSRKNGLWWVDGATYNIGVTLPYDSAGNTEYGPKAIALLKFYWEQDYLDPLS